MYRSDRAVFALALAILVWGTAAHGLSEDHRQPIQIQADSVEIDDKQGVSVYRGNVRLTQGSIVLLANTLTVHHPNRKMEKAIAEGKPAHYRELLDNRPGELRAQASRMEYLATQDRLVLSGSARVWQGGNEFAGDVIDYDIAKDLVRARGGSSAKRVEVIIQPGEVEAKPTERSGQ
jgi:lipopolysaccharide export system protein LptA